jgi:hypothetical protein
MGEPNMMRSVCRGRMRVTLALAACLLGGCRASLSGDWRLDQATPSRDEFCLEDVRFERDGSFAATTTIDGRTAREKGDFAFTGFQLTLRPAAGGERRYDAQLKFNRLEIRRGRNLVVLVRGKSRNARPPEREHGRPETGPVPSVDPPHLIHEGQPPQ